MRLAVGKRAIRYRGFAYKKERGDATIALRSAFILERRLNKSMNSRIELSSGDLRDFSPNIDFLVSLLEASVPASIAGTLSIHTSRAGALLGFAGDEEWEGLSIESEIIPRWMFAEIAFRELINRRVRKFLVLLELTHPTKDAALSASAEVLSGSTV